MNLKSRVPLRNYYGVFDLIETHHPFACGWYGKSFSSDCYIYGNWVINGWKYILDTYGKN